MIADHCFSWPSHIVANTDKDFIESRAYSICDIRYSFKESVLFIISNVQIFQMKVSPVFKAGERNDKNNYRPISLIPTVARVFERLIFEQLHSYLDNCNLICTQQSGFRPLHSTVTALLDLTND